MLRQTIEPASTRANARIGIMGAPWPAAASSFSSSPLSPRVVLAGRAQEHAAPAGLAAIAAFDRYPVIDDEAQMLYLSSYDRTGGNDDGFKGTYSALLGGRAGRARHLRRARPRLRLHAVVHQPGGRLERAWTGAGFDSTSTTKRRRAWTSRPTSFRRHAPALRGAVRLRPVHLHRRTRPAAAAALRETAAHHDRATCRVL